MPRSATVSAIEDSELISIRRADFFAILRKEHELAVKLLWQFLGVLADRLEKTSADLTTAREELSAEDITDAIFPEMESESQRLAEKERAAAAAGEGAPGGRERGEGERGEGAPFPAGFADERRSIEIEFPPAEVEPTAIDDGAAPEAPEEKAS